MRKISEVPSSSNLSCTRGHYYEHSSQGVVECFVPQLLMSLEVLAHNLSRSHVQECPPSKSRGDDREQRRCQLQHCPPNRNPNRRHKRVDQQQNDVSHFMSAFLVSFSQARSLR